MVHKVDGNPKLDSRDWSMYWNILNGSIDSAKNTGFRLYKQGIVTYT